MRLICVSRGSYSGGKAFAEELASRLGCACVGREEVLERATEAGIAAGKLEMASLKPHGLNERMVLEREHYQAFATAYLAERALQGPLVYHGRTGHLLLRRVSHLLRLRVTNDMEARIASVVQRFGMDRAKARRYIEEVEEDRRRWARSIYNLDWDASTGYDFIINLEQSSVQNVASAFCAVAQLPEFQETPASRRNLEDLLLASRCRTALARDDRTYSAGFKVQAEGGVVSITYLPRHAEEAEAVPAVVEAVPGVRRVLCSMAATRILWVQERFDPKAEVFGHLMDVAQRWEAAVDLLRFRAADTPQVIERDSPEEAGPPPSQRLNGGVEDDLPNDKPPPDRREDGGLEETFGALIRAGRAGGKLTVHGTANEVLAALDRTAPYSLVAIGDTYLDKGKAARVRLGRELGNTLHERMKVAVIQTDEMKEQYLFGGRQLATMLLYFGLTVLVYFLVFSNQQPILEFLMGKEGLQWHLLAAVSVAVFVPFIAYTYGKAAHYLLKLVRME